MSLVGRLFRQLEAQQRDERGGRVGQVVHGVRNNGNGTCSKANGRFCRTQQRVQRNAHNARAHSNGLAPFRGGRGFLVSNYFIHREQHGDPFKDVFLSHCMTVSKEPRCFLRFNVQ